MAELSRVEKHIRRRSLLRNRRGQFEQLWDDLSRVLLTRRQGFVTHTEDGDNRTDDIFDGTGIQAARSLANTVGSMIRPEGQIFARIRAEDHNLEREDENAFWLADTTERFNRALKNPKSRFRQATGECDMDLVVFGTGVLYSGLSNSKDHLIFQSVHLKDAIVMYDDEGNPSALYRSRRLMVWQLVEMFGKGKLSKKVQELIDQDKMDDKIEVLQVIAKRAGVEFEEPLLAKNMPFEHLWIEVASKHLISEDGFMELPVVAPRWDTSSGEDYGRSPGMTSLPDVNTLQAMGETILVAGQRVADPPMMAPNDGVMSEINTFPGGLSYYDVETASQMGGNPFFPMISGANLPVTREMQMDTRNQVLNAFFKNILNLPMNGPQMTATEIIQRKDEFIREVGPVFGRFESDYNRPIAERSFNLLLRAGAFLPVPESMAGTRINFEFEMPVTKIRKQVEAAAAKQWAMEMLELSNVKPEAADLVNIDELGRFAHDAAGIPHEILNGRQAVEALREQRAAAMQQQQQAEMLQQGAGVAEQLAGAANKVSSAGVEPQAQEA